MNLCFSCAGFRCCSRRDFGVVPVGGRRHDSALQPGPPVVDFREMELTVFRRIRTMVGRSIVSRPMLCSDRTPSICQWQLGILTAQGCQLPMATKESKAPVILVFLQKSFAY